MRRPASDKHRATPPASLWSRIPIRPIMLFAAVFAIFVDLLWGGWLLQVDERVAWIWPYGGPDSMPTADLFDRIGQRTICLPILFIVVYILCRRLHSIRPLVIAILGNLALNFFVGVVKLLTERESPRTGGPDLFVGNNLFPSGHTANVVFVYGLAAALIMRYGRVGKRARIALTIGVVGIFVFMSIVAIYRHTHWFTDLMAGGMIGAAVLDLCMRADAQWPAFRSVVRRAAGPAWSVIEWIVRGIRQVVVQAPRLWLRRAGSHVATGRPVPEGPAVPEADDAAGEAQLEPVPAGSLAVSSGVNGSTDTRGAAVLVREGTGADPTAAGPAMADPAMADPVVADPAAIPPGSSPAEPAPSEPSAAGRTAPDERGPTDPTSGESVAGEPGRAEPPVGVWR